MTEFWRSHRECAGVLHFCGLTYSRPGDKPRPEGGATSDHFLDLKSLQFEPNFERYVRDAFSPVGVMLDFWDDEHAGGSRRDVNVVVINDLPEAWQGSVSVRFMQSDHSVAQQSQPCTVPALARETLTFPVTIPSEPGDWTLVGELSDASGRRVQSLRDLRGTAAK